MTAVLRIRTDGLEISILEKGRKLTRHVLRPKADVMPSDLQKRILERVRLPVQQDTLSRTQALWKTRIEIPLKNA